MLKKLAMSAAMIFALNASCFAANGNDSVTSSKIFQDNDYKISVQLPEGFDYADDTTENVVVAAEDKKGGFYRVIAEDAVEGQAVAGTDKVKLHHIKDELRKPYVNNGFKIYHEYTVKVNPDRFGYFLDGFTQGKNDKGREKNAILIFFHNDKKFTVTLKAPYEQKGYLKNFKRFRTSITCQN